MYRSTKKKPDHVVQAVKEIWLQDTNRSALDVWRIFARGPSRVSISKRKVQQIVAEEKKKLEEGREFPLIQWIPWKDEQETAEDADFLLRLDAACLVVDGRHLYQHEAKWARRLRVVLADPGLNTYYRLRLVQMYARRQVTAFRLEEEAYTADLDGIITYQPWIYGTDNQKVYDLAVELGTVPALIWGETKSDPAVTRETFRDHVSPTGGLRSWWNIAKWFMEQSDKPEADSLAPAEDDQVPETDRVLLWRFWKRYDIE